MIGNEGSGSPSPHDPIELLPAVCPIEPTSTTAKGKSRAPVYIALGLLATMLLSCVLLAGGTGTYWYLRLQGAFLPSLRGEGELRRLDGHTTTIYGMSFSPDGKRLLSVGERTMFLWDLQRGKEIRRFDCEIGMYLLHTAAFSPDQRLGLSAGSNPQLWDLETGRQVRRFGGHASNGVFGAAFTPEGHLITGDVDGVLRTFDASTGELVRRVAIDRPGRIPAPHVRMLPGGKFAFCHNGLYDTQTAQLVRPVPSEMGYTYRSFAPDGSAVLILHSRTIDVWDVQEGRVRRSLTLATGRRNDDEVEGAALSPGARRVAAVTHFWTQVWDAETGAELARFRNLDFHPDTLTFSQDERLLAVGARDHSIRIIGLPGVTER